MLNIIFLVLGLVVLVYFVFIQTISMIDDNISTIINSFINDWVLRLHLFQTYHLVIIIQLICFVINMFDIFE